MTRRAARVALPGAAELFRTTAPAATQDAAVVHPGVGAIPPVVRSVRARAVRAVADRNPSGRERHEEKITVYVSPQELLDLESARFALRADHGLAVDRGRIVREALAVVLADLEAKGELSILVRRLRSE